MRIKLASFLLLLAIFCGIPQLLYSQSDFKVTYERGQKATYKPSLSSRINGVKEIQVYEPSSHTDMSRYVFGSIVDYFRSLGLRVNVVRTKYSFENKKVDTVYGQYHFFDDHIDEYLNSSNTLEVVAVITLAQGQYLSSSKVRIDIIDYVNDWVWNLPQIDIPRNSEKFINKLKNLITGSYYFNPQFSYIPDSYKTTWNTAILKDYLTKNPNNPLEGIYKGDEYTVGIKKDDDGRYYMIYLGGGNVADWKQGDVKAILTPSATATIFKADWYGKWKQKMDFTISFMNGGFVSIDPDKEQETYIKMFPDAQTISNNAPSEWTGTGFALKNNYIVTNYHVVDGAKSISILGINGNFTKGYSADVIATDKNIDLAILKVNGVTIPSANIPYSVKTTNAEVGEEVFVLGYPMTSTMGEEIKLTTGVVSSRSGFQGDVSLYQTTAPIQPGNSGGPLFDSKGNIIGIVSAKHRGAENVGYAIKASYLRNLLESSISSNILPQSNKIAGQNLSGKVKSAKNYVYYIICSSKENETFKVNKVSGKENSVNSPNQQQDIEKAKEYTRQAEDFYFKGEYTKAKDLLQKAVNMGYAAAQFKLGYLYQYGQGVKRNYQKAMELYKKAAAQDYVNAFCNIGYMYDIGLGVKQNRVKAAEWYQKASNLGDEISQKNLGFMYKNGRGVTKNYKKAFEFLSKSANKGNPEAQYGLGYLYENALGVNKDYTKAAEWYKKSADQGDEDAKEALKRIEKYL
jgi:S1-C subfamily serine protease